MARPLTVGLEAMDLVARLPTEVRSLRQLSLFVYTPSPAFEDRAHSLQQEGPSILDRVAQEAVRHVPLDGRRIVLPRARVGREALGRLADPLSPQKVLGVRSRISAAGQPARHLPMMDFKISPSPLGLVQVHAALRSLGEERGVLLESGQSYHYYGFRPLNRDRWLAFLGRCLLLAPLTDARYIAHRLLAGECTLRLTASERKPKVPRVVAMLGQVR